MPRRGLVFSLFTYKITILQVAVENPSKPCKTKNKNDEKKGERRTSLLPSKQNKTKLQKLQKLQKKKKIESFFLRFEVASFFFFFF